MLASRISILFYSYDDLVGPLHKILMMNSLESVGLLADVLGSILKAVVCRRLLLGLNIGPFPLLDYVVH